MFPAEAGGRTLEVVGKFDEDYTPAYPSDGRSPSRAVYGHWGFGEHCYASGTPRGLDSRTRDDGHALHRMISFASLVVDSSTQR